MGIVVLDPIVLPPIVLAPCFVGLDAKILRPYKQMIRSYNITLILSNMDSDTSET
jgi:hypothetical protein